MRTIAFCILHTGRPYLRAAIESIIDQADHIVILYTRTPSQGFQADIPCPDSHDDLLGEVLRPPLQGRARIQWIEGEWANESDHINAIWPYAEGYDFCWRFDADEISPPGMIEEMIWQSTETDAKAFRVPFAHFWRSFSKICRDGSHPIRLFRMVGGEGERTLDSKAGRWVVYHGGYAQPTRYIIYKLQVSGHRPEFRPDWFETRWLVNAQADVHPVCFPTHWMPVDFDKEQLPDVLKRHAFFHMDLIEG